MRTPVDERATHRALLTEEVRAGRRPSTPDGAHVYPGEERDGRGVETAAEAAADRSYRAQERKAQACL